MPFIPGQHFGISAALTTPFTPSGTVDTALLARHAQSVLNQGCSSVTLGGTTGEGSSLAMDEKLTAHKVMTTSGINAEQIVFAVLESAIPAAISASIKAAALGSKYILLAPPFYFKGVSVFGTLDWFRAVLSGISQTGLRVILYHIPQVTSVPITPDMVGILQNEFPTMVSGVKDSSGDRENTLTLLSRFKNLDILIGDERLLAEGISLGGSGAISGVANFRPDLLTTLLEGKPAHANLVALVNGLLQYPVTPAVKALVGYLSGADNWRRARAPLAGLVDAQYQALCKNYDALFGQ